MGNFSHRTSCKQCGVPRPQESIRDSMKPGDWVCPGCGDLVFGSRDSCKMCKTPKSSAGPEHFLLGQREEKPERTEKPPPRPPGALPPPPPVSQIPTLEEQIARQHEMVQQQQLLHLAATPDGKQQLQQLIDHYTALGYDASELSTLISGAGSPGPIPAPPPVQPVAV